MALCWVKAGACGQESSIEARKVDPTHVVFEITTTCEHIQALSEALGEVDVAHDMACRLDETQVYRLAVEHVCRNSCIMPAAILKAMEAAAGIFLPGDCSIEFVEGSPMRRSMDRIAVVTDSAACPPAHRKYSMCHRQLMRCLCMGGCEPWTSRPPPAVAFRSASCIDYQ